MKKTYTLIVVLLCLLSLNTSAQESIIGEINYTLLEKYIQTAKEYYPRRKVFEAQKDVSKTAITIAQINYLDIFSASYYYRPNGQAASTGGTATIPGTTGNTNVIFGNGIQYGISVNLANFLTKPFLVKRAKSEYKVAQLQSADYEITLVSEVKRRYYTYVQMLAELKIKTQTAQENKTVADNARRRFEKGEIALDGYNASRIQLSDSNTNQIQTEVNYLTAKDALEEMLGKKLSEIQ
jgi:outer membrane protein TolC